MDRNQLIIFALAAFAAGAVLMKAKKASRRRRIIRRVTGKW